MKKVLFVPNTAPLTEADIDLRIKCAIQYTDITALSQCMVTFLYDLSKALEAEGTLRHENKLAMSRATNRAVNIVNQISDEMVRINKAFLTSYYTLYDELIAGLDSAILLTGSERSLSMIDTTCTMITDKLAMLRYHNNTFEEMQCVENMPLVAKDLRDVKGERHDLEPIFRPILRKMISDKEYAAAKKKYMDYYKIKPRNNGSNV